MKRAVAQLENYLDAHRGLHEGHASSWRPCSATCTTSASRSSTRSSPTTATRSSTSASRSRSATIIDAAEEHDATAIGLCALLVSTSKQMPLAHPGAALAAALEYPVLIGGAAINRNFGLRALYPERARVRRRSTSPASSTARTRSRAWTRWTRSSTARRASALVEKTARGRDQAAREGPRARGAADRRRHRPLRRAHRHADPRAAVLGRARDRRRPRRGLPPPRHPRAVQAPLGRARREGRGVEEARCARTSSRGSSACGASRTTCTRGRMLGYFPVLQRGQRASSSSTPRTARRCSSASSSRASPATTASAWPTSTARRTAASSTSSPSRPSPPATRSPS